MPAPNTQLLTRSPRKTKENKPVNVNPRFVSGVVTKEPAKPPLRAAQTGGAKGPPAAPLGKRKVPEPPTKTAERADRNVRARATDTPPTPAPPRKPVATAGSRQSSRGTIATRPPAKRDTRPSNAQPSSAQPSSRGSSAIGIDTSQRLRDDLATQLEDNVRLTASFEELQRQRNQLDEQVKSELDKMNKLRESLEEQQQEMSHLRAQLLAKEKDNSSLQLRVTSEEAARAGAEMDTAMERTRAESAEADVITKEKELAGMAEQGCAQEALRRQMHETIQELKGNIRVFCRLRPAADPHDSLLHVPHTSVEPTVLELQAPQEKMAAAREKMTRFQFDRVFDADATQADIFKEVSHLTQSALDGFNVCIFAYGQTGSGKTFTMEGPPKEDLRGIVPRAIDQLFSRASELASLGWSYDFEVSFLEIYNDELHDLTPGCAAGKKLRLVDVGGKVSIPELCSTTVDSQEKMAKLLAAAASMRKTASTNMNDRSSRSHYVVRVRLSGTCASGETVSGELNLVDLAGSERVKDSGVTGDAFNEAKAINKSLSALGDVVSALAANKGHIPFRNSKLTHVLQNALSGSSKTLMMVNVSSTHYSETMSSLRFAQKTNGCQVANRSRGKP